MPIYTKHNVKTLGRDIVAIPFSFAPNGSSAVDQTSIIGQGVTSVARTDVGVFDVTLNKTWDIIAIVPGHRLATDADVTLSSWEVSGAVVTTRTRTGGSAADIAADAANRIGGVVFATRIGGVTATPMTETLKSASYGCVLLPFSFAPNGSSAVDATTIDGDGIESVTRAGTGLFDVVLKHDWTKFVGFCPSVALNTDADVTVESHLYTASSRTLRIRVRSGGSAADISADAANRLGGVIALKNSGLGK